MKTTEKTIDLTTGEETISERNETAEETKARSDREEAILQLEAEAAARLSARQVILDRLGLTEQEAVILLG
jgi:hypothetical protein